MDEYPNLERLINTAFAVLIDDEDKEIIQEEYEQLCERLSR